MLNKSLFERYNVPGFITDAAMAAHDSLGGVFSGFFETALYNQGKVLRAFWKRRIAQRHFSPTTGYGYSDEGRDALSAVFADVFAAEDALVRPQIVSGTHAVSLCLLSAVKRGEMLILGTGEPYDTLHETLYGEGGLREAGVDIIRVDLKDGKADIEAISRAVIQKNASALFLQRSRGYEWREALTDETLREAARAAKAANPAITVIVDNCYGEFCGKREPCELGADVFAGSLIKNPGGGLAPTGGYIAGKAEIVERAAQRLTAPGIGREVGSYAASYQPYFQGLFMAPHVVAEALKGAALFAKIFEIMGFETLPASGAERYDIIQAVRFDNCDALIAFCRGIQKASPVDSFASPEPWDMPGYAHKVIMAAGTFVAGASIELSADAPIKPPYTAYIQGGLTYEHCLIAAVLSLAEMAREGHLKG